MIRLSTLTLALVLAGCASAPQGPVTINLVSLNDFHGNLEPSRYTLKHADGKEEVMRAGGAEAVAAALQAWRKEDKDLLLVSTGDIVGASPALSSLWADEPTIEVMNMLNLHASAVGNHEFDGGRKELLRQQNGGCDSPHPTRACKFTPNFGGAKFTYLGANVIDAATGKPVIPGFKIEEVKGIKVGLVGVVLKDTPNMVVASGIAGLQFGDEAEAINAALPAMRAAGAQVIVALVHQGGRTVESPLQPGCSQLKGDIVDVVKKIDPSIKLVLTGHSHQGYLCDVDGRTVTQADTAGHLLTRVSMQVEPKTGAVSNLKVNNVVMKPGEYPADPKMVAFVAQVKERSKEALGRPIARVAGTPLLREPNKSGQSVLGSLVADAALDSTRHMGAQLAFMNSGGVRRDLEAGPDGMVSFGQTQVVLPFGNTTVLMNLTGAQIRRLLERQWPNGVDEVRSVLQVSEGFSYAWDAKRPEGSRIVPGSLKLNGKPMEDGATYRIATNNFLAEGSDGYPEFGQGTDRNATGMLDLDGFIAYLKKIEGQGAAMAQGGSNPAPRIVKVN
ncbi:bifunctional metallophosphatase/5'-nucleotidase [Telluria beijingensis]|uniref:bifunctional metallophosphatase/5'-nucleotidase n=1 Tax=Telluria beijingensis TaxID=3068633 RepID=UPI0027957DA2|nr:bifunctional metallophosphatase/5'-nucleotidase [Massilia sp. REN29]